MIKYDFLPYSIPYDIIGVDLSRHNYPVTWTALLPLVSFVIHRTGDGVRDNFVDERFAEAWRELKARRYPRGSYWFFRPNMDPIEQAKDMINILAGDWGEMGVYLDLEVNETRMSKVEYTNSVLKFINYVDSKNPSLYNKLTGFYSGPGFWNVNVEPSMIPRLSERPKWTAQWPYLLPPTRPSPLPAGWTQWDIWQWTAKGGDKSSGPGLGKKWGVYSYGLDVNVWRGSESEFESRFHCQVVNKPPSYSLDKPPVAYKPNTSLSIRPKPDETAIPILGVTRTEAIPVIGMTQDRMNRIWYRIAGNEPSKYQMWVPGWYGTPILTE